LIHVSIRIVCTHVHVCLSFILKTLEQERYKLRLLLEQVQTECETKIVESTEDKYELVRQLNNLQREQRAHAEQNTQIIKELTETNFKLSKDWQLVRISKENLIDHNR
jgi:hypothetical protein